ncbi:hypothetical protein Gotur_009924 [Gossypium turneri]
MTEETPLKQIAPKAAKILKNKEIVLHKPKSLKKCFKRDISPRCFSKRNSSVFTDCYTKILTIFFKQIF